jgi:hypothetical protein
MLGNILNPPEPFGDIIRTHFRLKADSIAAQLDRWITQDDGKPITADGGSSYFGNRGEAGSSSSGFAKDVGEMKRILKQLQNGEEPSA